MAQFMHPLRENNLYTEAAFFICICVRLILPLVQGIQQNALMNNKTLLNEAQ